MRQQRARLGEVQGEESEIVDISAEAPHQELLVRASYLVLGDDLLRLLPTYNWNYTCPCDARVNRHGRSLAPSIVESMPAVMGN